MSKAAKRQFDYNLHTFHSPQFQNITNDAISSFIHTPIYALPPPGQFIGAGVYGLYYIGKHGLYAKLSRSSCIQPIYIGKAVPPGWRTARTTESRTPDLYRRLAEHTRSIQQASNLQIEDFRCRFMILAQSDLIVPVEAKLIRKYEPLWNTVIEGFGNHDPGAGRYNQARSEWDVLHPGRPWAERLTGKSPRPERVLAKIESSLTHSAFP